MKVLKVKAILTDQEIEKKEGSYFPESHYKNIINTNCDVYGILEDGSEKLLLKFRKNVIPNNICTNAFIALEKHAQHRNYNRGAAAGKLDIKKLPEYVGKITKKDSFRIFYNTRAGKKTKDNVGNMAMSNIAGYYDKPDRNEYMKMQNKHNNNNKHNKRNTSSKKTKKIVILGKVGIKVGIKMGIKADMICMVFLYVEQPNLLKMKLINGIKQFP